MPEKEIVERISPFICNFCEKHNDCLLPKLHCIEGADLLARLIIAIEHSYVLKSAVGEAIEKCSGRIITETDSSKIVIGGTIQDIFNTPKISKIYIDKSELKKAVGL